ncbi:unnamed protein product [Heligmosomoides polygyrus]|uniref:E2F_TDP domain-containing protein n=1 Tax=Heligmosomoides polygyrus TaxID=6339 RepID=A0A183FUJ1_HELPZ|nr:unnamed protein product [Heligmosomoides polygyrus]
MDEPATLLSAMIKDLGNDVNKVKEEVSRYIQPSPNGHGTKSRILKVIAGNSREDHVATRMDNSLLVTTRKFLELRNLNDSVNLNDAAEALNVPKRRLYDITNVLEGIDLVEKIGKNSIRWKMNDGDALLLEALRDECKELRREEAELDSIILDLTSALNLVREDPTDKPYAYLQLRDLQSLECFSDQTLIVLKSLPDAQSVIEVADPSKTGKYQIKLKTDNYTPLRAFLCPSNSPTYANIEDVLYPKGEDQKPSVTNKACSSNEFVLPDSNVQRDPLSDLITPDKMFHDTAYPTPLKMLIEPDNHFSVNNESDAATTLLTPHANDTDPYSFPSSGLSLSDLFSSSDWELPQ